MRKGTDGTIPPEDALDRVFKQVRPLSTTTIPLDKSLGWRLAEDVRSDRDLPPADRSAMDGYAVRSADLAAGPCNLRILGEIAAGSASRLKVRPGTCVRILTGANIPPGADTVVMVEQTQEQDGIVSILVPVEHGMNILRQAEDARKGDLLLHKGTRLEAMQIGVCAAVGKVSVKVYRRPSVTILCTGKELRDPCARVRRHELRNSNGPALCAALATWGFGKTNYLSVPDDLKSLCTQLRRAITDHHVVLLTGGMSKGKYDFVHDAVMRIGATIRFHGVRMKPGKPLLYATLPGNKHIFGLPGNPLSAMTGFGEFVLPALRRLSGLDAKSCRPRWRVPLASEVTTKGGRKCFMLAQLRWDHDGPRAVPVASRSSADLVAGGRADGVIVVTPEMPHLDPGEMVEFHPWRPMP